MRHSARKLSLFPTTKKNLMNNERISEYKNLALPKNIQTSFKDKYIVSKLVKEILGSWITKAKTQNKSLSQVIKEELPKLKNVITEVTNESI